MAEIVWTESALNDLDDIGDYIAKDSIRYAELQNEAIRQLIIGSYRIIYQVNDDFRIEILTVHRSSRLLGNTYDFDNHVNE